MKRSIQELERAFQHIDAGRDVAFVARDLASADHAFDCAARMRAPADEAASGRRALFFGDSELRIVVAVQEPEAIVGWKGAVVFGPDFGGRIDNRRALRWIALAQGCNAMFAHVAAPT